MTWEQLEANQKKLQENAQAYGADRKKSPPREGHALLQGFVLCRRCGKRMTVHYLRYEAELAKRRFMQVDPDNSLVADEHEGEWIDKLRAHKEALPELEEQK